MAFHMQGLITEYGDGRHSFFTSDRECIEYLLGVNLEPLEEYALLITQNKARIITPHELTGCQAEQIPYEGYSNLVYQDKLLNILKVLDDMTLPPQTRMELAYERQIYADYFRSRGLEVKDITQQVQKASMVKDEDQVNRIRECVIINEKAYRALMGRDVYGETELSLFHYIEEAVMQHTGCANKMIYDFLAGKRSGGVSGFPTNYRLTGQDTLIADLLPRHKGVYADMTRTYFAGKPNHKQFFTYELLNEALHAAEKRLLPGTLAAEVYDSIYMVFKKHGLEQNFLHHAGHGVGLGYYEAPYLLKEETSVLEENMVVALEPGLYYAGEFGIRIENNYLITGNGPQRLGGLSLEIEDYILPCHQGRYRSAKAAEGRHKTEGK